MRDSDGAARATWALVVVTVMLLAANAILAWSTVETGLLNEREAQRTREETSARVYMLLSNASDNGPSGAMDLGSNEPVYDLRTWCIVYVRGGATTVNTAFVRPFNPLRQAPIIAPGLPTTIPFKACTLSSDRVDSSHPVIRGYVYALYREFDGTPHEAQWGTEWNRDMREFGNANPKLFPQHEAVLQLARRDLEAYDYLKQRSVDSSL